MQEPPVRDDGLQLDEHRTFQKTLWAAERIAWAVFGLIVLAAIVGLTGAGGYFAQSTASLATGELQYPRIARWNATEVVKVTFTPGTEARRLTIGQPFFEYFQVSRIDPRPEESTPGAEGTVLQFAEQPAVPLTVVIHVRAYRPGLPTFSMALDGVAVEVSPIILP